MANKHVNEAATAIRCRLEAYGVRLPLADHVLADVARCAVSAFLASQATCQPSESTLAEMEKAYTDTKRRFRTSKIRAAAMAYRQAAAGELNND